MTNTAGDFALWVSSWDGAGGLASSPSTSVAITGITPATTVLGVVDAINAQLNGLVATLSADATITASGRIRITQRYAGVDHEIWAHSGGQVLPGQPTIDDPIGLSVAEAVFGGNNPWGRGSGPADSYRIGTANAGYSFEGTFTPSFGAPFDIEPC